MLQALLLTAGLAVVSFAMAGVLVFALVRTIEHLDVEPRPDPPMTQGGRLGRPRRFFRRREPAWWPEFERAFADYVRTGAGRES